MSTKPTQRAIAAALGIDPGLVSRLKGEGMPVHSIEAAVTWRAKRKGTPSPTSSAMTVDAMESIPPIPAAEAIGLIGELERRVDKQRRLVEAAHARSEYEIANGDGDVAKKAADLAASQHKILIMLERELRQRRVDAGELVPAMAAKESFGRILAEIIAAIDAGENTLCLEANPDNPGRASKAFRKFRDQVRSKISNVQ